MHVPAGEFGSAHVPRPVRSHRRDAPVHRYTKDRQKLFQRIRYAPLRLPATLTPEACDVLTRLLDRDPVARLGAKPGPDGAAEVEAHPFFREVRGELVRWE